MRYPVAPRFRLPVILISGPAAIALLFLMSGRLEGPGTRLGIVDLELAGTPEQAARILHLWNERGVLDFVRVSLLLDLPFIAAYCICLGTLCAMASARFASGSAASVAGVTLA